MAQRMTQLGYTAAFILLSIDLAQAQVPVTTRVSNLKPSAKQELGDLAGTRWRVTEAGRSFDVLFRDDGSTTTTDERPDRRTGKWQEQNGVVSLAFGDQGPEYAGWLWRGRDLLGVAKGAETSWVWRAKRVAAAKEADKQPGQRPRVVRRRNRDAARAGPGLAGSRWLVHRTSKSSYEVELLPGGKLRNGNPADRTEDNDAWEQDGEVVRLFFNNRYATYQGCLLGGTEVEGSAHNVRNKRWLWTMTRIHKGDATKSAPAKPAAPSSRPSGKGR